MNKIKLPTAVSEILNKLKKNKFEIYVVGGGVRNLIMGRPNDNWDFTTNATPEDLLKLFPDAYYNNKYGTVSVPINDLIFEITTYRSEKGYSDKRHPDKVIWGKKLEDDLARRDFTINAIAYDGIAIRDPFKGQEDITQKIIRAVGDPAKRFSEDALRLIRAVRIAAQLGFTIEEKTHQAIKQNAHLLKNVSGERIRDEFLRILESDFPDQAITLLKNNLLLKEFLPELEEGFEVDQKSPNRHHLYDVGTHLLMSLKYCKSTDPIVRLATLLHDIGKPRVHNILADGTVTFYNHEIISTNIAKDLADRLKLSKKDSSRLTTLVRWHQFSVDERQTDSALRRFIRRVGKENLNDMLDLRIGDRLGGGARETSWRLELYKKRLAEVQKQPFTVTDLKVSGFDVMKILKIKPGPKVGEVLNKLFENVENKALENKRETLLAEIKNYLPD